MPNTTPKSKMLLLRSDSEIDVDTLIERLKIFKRNGYDKCFIDLELEEANLVVTKEIKEATLFLKGKEKSIESIELSETHDKTLCDSINEICDKENSK